MMSGLIPLKSEQGEHLLKEILGQRNVSQKYILPSLIPSHYKQKTDSTCGVASCLMLFNARLTALYVHPMSEYQLLVHPYLVHATNNTISDIFKIGLTIKQVGDILTAFRCEYEVHLCKIKNDDGAIDKFRSICKDTFKHHNATKGIIINYYMKDIGQPFDFGHHSPIAAYNETTDRVLLLDCWEPNVCWVKIRDLYNAMATIDNDSKQFR
eukprot:391011_1